MYLNKTCAPSWRVSERPNRAGEKVGETFTVTANELDGTGSVILHVSFEWIARRRTRGLRPGRMTETVTCPGTSGPPQAARDTVTSTAACRFHS
jgi:hypothetical protein